MCAKFLLLLHDPTSSLPFEPGVKEGVLFFTQGQTDPTPLGAWPGAVPPSWALSLFFSQPAPGSSWTPGTTEGLAPFCLELPFKKPQVLSDPLEHPLTQPKSSLTSIPWPHAQESSTASYQLPSSFCTPLLAGHHPALGTTTSQHLLSTLLWHSTEVMFWGWTNCCAPFKMVPIAHRPLPAQLPLPNPYCSAPAPRHIPPTKQSRISSLHFISKIKSL